MPLLPIKIPPGIQSETPSLTSEPAWRDGDKIRFKAGQPEKIGGWVQDLSGLNALTGVTRSLLTWRLNQGFIVSAFGTNEKVHLLYDGQVTDITPLRTTNSLSSDPFTRVNGSTTVTVTDTAHGSSNGDYVTFSGAVCTGLTDSEINANHKITYIDANSYTITVTTAAIGSGSTGGAAVTGEYEISIGPVSSVANVGYGAGPYSQETYGDARSVASSVTGLRYWSMDNFGQDLILTHENGRIYQWIYNGDFANRATLITESPAFNELVIVTNPDRHLVTFASEITGTQNKLLVRWADQETTNDWTPAAENTAGDQILSGGSEIRAVKRTQSATLIWTDIGLHNMQFIGTPFTFGFQELATNCGAVSKSCVVTLDTRIFWMGKEDFFIYDGVVRRIECTVHRDIFQNINLAQITKVISGLNREFDEIIWFYPRGTNTEISHYVIFNYAQNIWYTGTLARTAWEDSELNDNPFGVTADGTIFRHESGVNANGSAITAYIESSEFDIENGDHFFFIKRVIPDMTIPSGSVDYILKTRRYPHSTQVTDTTKTIDAATEKIDVRIRTRSLALRIESDALGDDWRMGTARMDARPDGKR
jgi:hypothetical protein